MKNETELEGRIEIVGDVCTIYPKRRSTPIVARVLRTLGAGHQTQIYLDRLVHERAHTKVCGFDCSGAVSTILRGAPVADPLSRSVESVPGRRVHGR